MKIVFFRPILIPFVNEFVPIVDLEKKEIWIQPPEGLLELSQIKYIPCEHNPKDQIEVSDDM